MREHLRTPLALVVAVWLSISATGRCLGQGAEARPILQITIGTTTTDVAVLVYYIPDKMLQKHSFWDIDDSWKGQRIEVSQSWRQSLLLRLARDAYLSIPICLFRSAELIEGEHVVTLADGSQCEGRLLGTVRDSYGNEATLYDLSEAQTVSLLNECPVRPDLMVPEAQTPVWRLKVQLPLEFDCELVQPRLVSTYWSSSGWLVGGARGAEATERFEIHRPGAEAVAMRLPEVLRFSTRRSAPRRDARATRTPEERELLKQVSATTWLQTTPGLSLSSDGCYLAYGRDKVIELATKRVVSLPGELEGSSSVCFLPTKEPVLLVHGGSRSWLVDVASCNIIGSAPVSNKPDDTKPGTRLAFREHTAGLRILPGGLYVSWWVDGLRVWKWTATTKAELIEDSEASRGAEALQALPCELVSALDLSPWQLHARHRRYGLVSQDGRLLLLPVNKKLPTDEISPHWILVDLSKPEAPTSEGVILDWLSDIGFNALHKAPVLSVGTRRRLPQGSPIYVGVGGLVTLGRREGIAIFDVESSRLHAEWTANDLERLRLRGHLSLEFLVGSDFDDTNLGTTITVKTLRGDTAEGTLLPGERSKDVRDITDYGWYLSGYFPDSGIRLLIKEPTCTLERAAAASEGGE